MDRQHAMVGVAIGGLLALVSGCAGTVRQAAKEAAPVAVEGGIKSASKPETRDRVAALGSDPEIRQAAKDLAQAVTEGALSALTEEERLARASAATDAFVRNMSHSLAASLKRDFAPAISTVVSSSVHRALDQETERRLEALARAIARGSVEGASEGWQARLEKSGPVLNGLVHQMAREAGRGATLGFQDAVATSTTKQRDGEGQQGNVLAAAGRTSDSLLALLRGAGWVLVVALVVVLLAGLALFVKRQRHRPIRG